MTTVNIPTIKEIEARAKIVSRRRMKIIEAHLRSDSALYDHRAARLISELDRQMDLLCALYDRVRRQETKVLMQQRANERMLADIGIVLPTTNGEA